MEMTSVAKSKTFFSPNCPSIPDSPSLAGVVDIDWGRLELFECKLAKQKMDTHSV